MGLAAAAASAPPPCPPEAMTAGQRVRATVIAQLLREGWRPPPLTDEQADRLIDDIGRIGRKAQNGLTVRERQVLELAAEGATAKRSAHTLGVSCETVTSTLAHARLKLAAASTTHAVAIAIRRGLL